MVPTLVSRAFDFSGNPRVAMTNQSHREWIYRQAFHMGRHVIGYEVQKVLAAVDWFKKRGDAEAKVGVAGYGEGGLIAFYAAAADPRIDAALVSGYFDSRQRVVGRADLPQRLGPAARVRRRRDRHADRPARAGGRVQRGAGRGRPGAGHRREDAAGRPSASWPRRPWKSVAAEFKRIDDLVKPGFQSRHLVHGDDGKAVSLRRRSRRCRSSPRSLGVQSPMELAGEAPERPAPVLRSAARQQRQVSELEGHVQALLRGADKVRDAFFLNDTTLIRTLPSRGERFRMFRVKEQSADVFAREVAKHRTYLARGSPRPARRPAASR